MIRRYYKFVVTCDDRGCYRTADKTDIDATFINEAWAAEIFKAWLWEYRDGQWFCPDHAKTREAFEPHDQI